MAPSLSGTAAALTFTSPPPGLSPVVDFELAPVEGALGLYTLRDRVGADIRLFLVDPALFVPDYAPRFSAEQWLAVRAHSAEEVGMFVVATMSDGGPVVNLLAPVLVNAQTGAAAQIILDGTDWPVRAPLVAPAA
jgi:flagellar assembly factor FliW